MSSFRWLRSLALLALLLLPEPARAQEPSSRRSDERRSDERERYELTRAVMQWLARAWDADAVQADDATRYRIAKQAYEAYLARFPGGPDHYEMQYAYAQLLWKMARHAARSRDWDERQQSREYFRQAHEQLVRTLELDPEGQFTVEAAWWQVEAMRDYLRYREPAVGKQACELDIRGVCWTRVDYSPIELSAEAQRMLGAYDTFKKYVKAPNADLAEIEQQRIRLLLHHNRFDQAEPALWQFIETFADVDHSRERFVWSVATLVDVLTVRWLQAETPQHVLARGEVLEAGVAKLSAMNHWKQLELEVLRGDVQYLLGAVSWRSGLAHRELGQHAECAAQFLDLADRFDMHSEASTMLWTAAECLIAGSRDGQAVTVLERLLLLDPGSEHAPDAILQLAELHQALARFDDAARYYETFAGYLHDERTDDALENAYLLRLGLGHGEQAQADLRRFERLYRRKDVGRAAKLFWAQHELLEDDEARRTHALEYLESYGRKGGLDRELVAEAVIGQIDWRRSCPEPLLHDSCITITRIPRFGGAWDQAVTRAFISFYGAEVDWKLHNRYTPPKHCGIAIWGVVQVNSRDPVLAKSAQARFEKVLSLARKAAPPADDAERVAAFRAAWGMAIVYATDQEYEQWLRLELPEGLDFFVDEWLRDPSAPRGAYETWRAQDQRRQASRERLDEFMAKKRRVGEALQASYAKVDQTESPAWMLAAAARMAAIHQHVADQLLRAPIPQSVAEPDQMEDYCAELRDRADPIREHVRASYRACLDRATELQYDNEFSRMCEVELQQLDLLSPATHELFGEPIVTSSRIAPLGLIAEP